MSIIVNNTTIAKIELSDRHIRKVYANGTLVFGNTPTVHFVVKYKDITGMAVINKMSVTATLWHESVYPEDLKLEWNSKTDSSASPSTISGSEIYNSLPANEKKSVSKTVLQGHLPFNIYASIKKANGSWKEVARKTLSSVKDGEDTMVVNVTDY